LLDSPRSPAGTPVVPRRRSRGERWRRWLIGLAVVLAVLVVLVAGFGTLAYYKLDSNIRNERIDDALGERPTRASAGPQRPLNIVLIGSDTRAGGNAEYGRGVEGERGDVTILLHLSADRQRAVAVSIPRDSVVQIPSCRRPDGTQSPPQRGLFNSAYSMGGSACTIRTLEELTDVYVDHHVVVDFEGFKNMVDALGAVEVCVSRDVDDEDSGLRLTKGRHEVRGEMALAFVRNRKGLGDGSDLSRIERQQAFLSSMIQKATSLGVLTNPKRLYDFLDAATRSVTTDPGLASLNELRKLAQSVQGIGLDRIRFVTVPVEPYPPNPNQVRWSQPRADTLWRLLRTDEPLPGDPVASPAPSTPSASPTAKPTVRTPPSRVRVRVLDGSGRPSLALTAAADLRGLGFNVLDGVGEAGSGVMRTIVRHSPAYDESGRTLSSAVPGSTALATPGLGRTLEIVIGADYAGVREVTVAPAGPDGSQATPTPTFSARTADEDVCA
jgi:LCP family protein required for cell wall assembly